MPSLDDRLRASVSIERAMVIGIIVRRIRRRREARREASEEARKAGGKEVKHGGGGGPGEGNVPQDNSGVDAASAPAAGAGNASGTWRESSECGRVVVYIVM